MSKIIVVRGIPASGKSTWAKEWVLEDPTHRVRVNMDDIRNMLGKYWVIEREPLVKRIKENAIYNALDFGYDLIIDNMNLNPKEIASIKRIVSGYPEYSIEFKDFFDVPLDVCIERDSKRDNPIGAKTITDIYNKYKSLYDFS